MYVIEKCGYKTAVLVKDITRVFQSGVNKDTVYHTKQNCIDSSETFDQAVARLTLASGGEQWVDCNHRYPPSGQLVLVTDGCKEFETAWYDGGSGGTIGAWKNTQGQFLPWFRPVAWMPLPMRYVKPS